MPDGFQHLIMDSLQNLVSGLNTQRDLTSAGRFYQMAGMSRGEVDAIYRSNALGGKVVDLPADDMVREWRTWNTTKSNIEALEAAERQFAIQDKVHKSLKLAAKDGGCLIVIGTGDDPELPLNPNSVGRGGLKYVHVVSRWDVSVETLDRDPLSPWFMQPTYYRMFAPDGQYVRIHPSRTVCVVTTPRLDVLASGQPWGDSIYERVRTAVRDATAAFQAAASIMQEAKIDVISVPDLSRHVATEAGRNNILARFSTANTLKSINNALLLDSLEKWEQKTASFAGHPEMIDRFLLAVAAAADMPVTRLIGRSPAGLNATGEADLEAYYTMIRSRQQMQLRPMLSLLDDVLIRSALGRTPRGIWYDWKPLWSVSAEKAAQINLANANAVKAYAETGIFKREALAKAAINQLQDDGFLGTLGELGEAAVAAEADAPSGMAPATATPPAATPGPA